MVYPGAKLQNFKFRTGVLRDMHRFCLWSRGGGEASWEKGLRLPCHAALLSTEFPDFPGMGLGAEFAFRASFDRMILTRH